MNNKYILHFAAFVCPLCVISFYLEGMPLSVSVVGSKNIPRTIEIGNVSQPSNVLLIEAPELDFSSGASSLEDNSLCLRQWQ